MLSVIVPTCNRPIELAECLRRLSSEFQGLSEDSFQVIVTDDGQSEPAERLCKSTFPSVIYIHGPAKGPAANRNNGVAMAKHDWIVFVDDDCLPEPGLLKAYLARINSLQSRSLIALIGPTFCPVQSTSLLWEAPHNPKGDGRISANFAISQTAFHAVGRFDERFSAAAIEDTEFFSRFEFSGGSIEFVPEAIVNHPLRRIGSAKSRAKKWEGKVIWALDQNASPYSVLWRLPWHVFRVIQSRFRGAVFSLENMQATGVFALEWLHVVLRTGFWVRRWSKEKPSQFWRDHTARFGPPPKYGF